MSTTDRTAVETAWGVAEMQGVDDDLDAIREIDTDADGVTVRVLLQDGEDERDQVGFDSTRPQGHMADELFRDSLRNGMRSLKQHMRGSSTSTTDEDDVDQEESKTNVDANDSAEDPAETATEYPSKYLELTVGVDDNSLRGLREELEEFLEEIDDVTVEKERVEEIEDRLDNIDERLKNLEDQLSMLGST